ncbi:MAG: hypothetical protein QS748_08320 [Candidatus Endonucleobacter bathymodioli]|uniref:Uncharacterized protein n=1 Tax=Candidatus Endonucleibacter bathymodioli TaxID=539814 RepID=A0AA90SMT0_9GAMM|nr:hypothetical protein [Candidatus Endonucleobacter bathymodioli]
MLNLTKLLEDVTPVGWLIIASSLIAWVLLTYVTGIYSEKKWGDRESGALLGFFVPGLIFTFIMYMR